VALTGTHGNFTLQHYNGLYWNMTNNTHWHDANHPSPTTWSDFMLSSSPTTFWLNNDAVNGVDGVGFQVCCTVNSNTNIIYSNGYTYRVKLRPSDTTAEGYNLEFYRFSEEALDLRLALHEGLKYLVEDYGTRFDEAAFDAMCNKLNEVRLQFDTTSEALGMAPSNMTDAKKRTCMKLTDEVLAAIAAVQRTDIESPDYIDIPIEVLDFRGDGLLFENASVTPYSLSIGGAKASYPANFPGWNSGGAAADLAYGTLVNGNIVYTKATVDYVAGHLYKQTALVTPANQMNRIFYDLIKSGKLTYDANDYAKTIAKCEPAIEGGKLSWGDDTITTYHDLAYYLLSHMWKKSEDVLKTETLPNGSTYNTTYNMPVDDLKTLRLFKNSDGKYSYATNKMSSAADGYIQNVTDSALTIHKFDPTFHPVDRKGFESSSLYGTATEGASDNAHNYLFTLHAYGGFVYSEDANLEFNFLGDDDVYFYVNNQLVCDIGGMHNSVSKGVKLNDVAAKLQLKDGQICRFDMFYAERHTVGINLNFTTNIKIMDENIITKKSQYDAETNRPLMDGAVVPLGSKIGYEFSMLNRRSTPTKELTFTDTQIGVIFDSTRQKITLNDETSLSDLTVSYSTYDIDAAKVYDGKKVTVFDNFEDFETLIRTAVADRSTATPLQPGTYSYTPASEAELLTILTIGIPASCNISIRGIQHTMPDTPAKLDNVLSTACTPVQYSHASDGTVTVVDLERMLASANCSCQTMDLDMIAVGDPYTIVMDYAKTTEINLSNVHNTVSASGGVVLTYIGSTFNGMHGTIKTKKPSGLTFTQTGNCRDTDKGYYAMPSAGTLRFTPEAFMNEPSSFFAVYQVTAPSIANFTTCYIMKEVAIVPATSVYYETDFADENVFRHGKSDGLLINFGAGDNGDWNATHARATATKTGGVLKGEITGTDPFVYMTNRPYNYIVKPGDVVKVRIKSAPSTGTGLQVFFTTTTNTSLSGTGGISTGVGAYNPDNQWQTVTMPIYSAVYGQTVTAIRIDPIGNNDSFSSKGSYEIDWVYIGPDEAYNTPILADFGSGDTTAWTATRATVTKADGVLKVTATGETYNNYTDPYVTMTSASCTMKRVIEPGDVVMVRVKSPAGSGNNLQVLFMTDTNSSPVTGIETYNTTYIPNGEWQTITLGIASGLVGKQIIGLRLDPSDSLAASATTEYDWVYVGPRMSKDDGKISFATTDAEKPWQFLGSSENAQMQAKLPNTDPTYGYDASYNISGANSNNGTYFVEGVGVPKMNSDGSINYEATTAYTEASFNFRGTGFDIISRTGPQQGALRALIYRQSDDSFVKAATVINKSDHTFYQVPVLSVQDLDHDDYTVKIFVNAPYTNANYPDLNRGAEFYFDAVRIYDPIDVEDGTEAARVAYNAYLDHGEAHNVVEEIRKMLITAGTFNAGGGMSGVAYLDKTPENEESPIANYTAVGPNNETYLSPNNAIAFKVESVGGLPSSFDIGAKSVDGKEVTLNVVVSSSAPSALPPSGGQAITSCTAQYHPINVNWTADETCHYAYFTVSNNGSGILSITDIKYAYNTPQKTVHSRSNSRYLRFVVDEALAQALPTECTSHEFDYTARIKDHVATCIKCGFVEVQAHAFENGLCPCGAEENPVPILDESLKFNMDISVGAEMVVNYNFMAGIVSDYTDFYLEVKKNVAGAEPIVTVFDSAVLDAVNNPADGEVLMYNASYTGINAKEMGDTFETTLYAIDADGKVYRGETVASSIKEFLMGKLEDAKSSDELKTMAVDMLRYGEAAQHHFSYDTENLVTNELTEEHLAYATKELPEAVNYQQISGDGANVTTSIIVGSKVELSLSTIVRNLADPSAVKCVITNEDGKVLAELATGCLANAMFSAKYDNVGAREMRKMISATFYDADGNTISKTLRWSVESYAAQTRANAKAGETEINMVNAMLTYGDSVAAYLDASGL